MREWILDAYTIGILKETLMQLLSLTIYFLDQKGIQKLSYSKNKISFVFVNIDRHSGNGGSCEDLSLFKLLYQSTTNRVAYKQQKFISQSSGCWKSKIRVSAWSGKGPLLGCRFPLVFSHISRN